VPFFHRGQSDQGAQSRFCTGAIGNIPPAGPEDDYYAAVETIKMAAQDSNQQASL
jgi:hypothetical protein